VSAFKDAQEARDVLGGFFRQESTEDDHIFAGSGFVVGYTLHDPAVRVVLDASRPAQPGNAYDVYVDDPNAPDPKVDISMSADDFDKLYKGEIAAMSLMMSGKAKAKGDVTAAMRLLPAMARAIPRYKKYRE
jgi:putative sterol carrier protein